MPLTTNRRTNALDFGRAFWRGSRVARSTYALGNRPTVASWLRLRVDRLGLRIADCLGQHPVQVSLGRRRLRHLAPISLLTSRLPWPSAQPLIVGNFSRTLPAASRILWMPPVCRRAETPSRGLVALGLYFYCSQITSNFSDHWDDDTAATVCRAENRRLSLPIRFNAAGIRGDLWC